MPLSPTITEWLEAHMPHPLALMAGKASENCLKHEVLAPVGFIFFQQGEDLTCAGVPMTEGFQKEADKDAFVATMQQAASKYHAHRTLIASEAWMLNLRPASQADAQHLLQNLPRPSERPDRIEALILNYEHYDAQGKVIAEIATFKIIRENGQKVGLELLCHLRDQNGGKNRLEGRMAHILVPKENP